MTSLSVLNTQPKEKQVYRDDGKLEVIQAWKTLQGEGSFAGTPAVFVRLAGCDLWCSACDTQYTNGRQLRSVDSLANEIDFVANGCKLVVLTGGEPLRQNIIPLIHWLTEPGYMKVQIETNGTLFLNDIDTYHEARKSRLYICCSPKTSSIHPKLRPHIDSLKYIVEAGQIDPIDGLPLTALGMPFKPMRPWPEFSGDVFVQPLDTQDEDKNKVNRDLAVEICMKFGYRLSLQVHKYLGLE